MNLQTIKPAYIAPTWDKRESTFYWLIFLNENHESYQYKSNEKYGAIILDGYSKTIGHNERNNKQELLLKNFIFLTKQYSYKSKSIRIFARSGEIIDKKTDPCIIEIYPNKLPLITRVAKEILFEDNRTKLMDDNFCRFLHSIYQMNLKGIDINQFRPH